MAAQSPLQRQLIEQLPLERTCFYVDGPYDVYVRHTRAQYVLFSTDPLGTAERHADQFRRHVDIENIDETRLFQGVLDECYESEDEPTVHEQADMTILALGMLEQVSQDTASAWVSHLQQANPRLSDATILLRVKEKSNASSADRKPSGTSE